MLTSLWETLALHVKEEQTICYPAFQRGLLYTYLGKVVVEPSSCCDSLKYRVPYSRVF